MSLIPAFETGLWNAWILMIWLFILNLVIMLDKNLYQRFGGSSDQKSSPKAKIGNLYSTLLWLLSTIYSIFLPLKLGSIWLYAGLVVFLPGLYIMAMAIVNFTSTQLNEPVTSGVYRYSRHPGYASLILIYLGVGIASASWIFLLISVILGVLLRISAKNEENECLERYGDAYREYMSRTPRWLGLPKISKSHG